MKKSRAFALLAGLLIAVGGYAATTGGNVGGVQYVQGFTGMTPVTVNGAVTTGTTSTADTDNKSNTVTNIGSVFSYPSWFDGTTWDRARGDSTGGLFVQGPAAHDAPVVGNPVRLGGRARTSTLSAVANDDTVDWPFSVNGVPALVNQDATTDGLGNGTGASFITSNPNNVGYLKIFPYIFGGTTWDRARSAGVGNNIASTGIAAAAPYGQYTGNATQPAITTGNYAAAQLDPAGNLRTAPQRPTATDILAASVSVTATTASTALITISAGRTWVGRVCLSVSGSKAAAATGNGEVQGTILTANGTGTVTPAAGTYFEVDTAIGANAATGATGTQGSEADCQQMTVVSSAGGTSTVNYSATCTSTTACRVSASAFGVMQ